MPTFTKKQYKFIVDVISKGLVRQVDIASACPGLQIEHLIFCMGILYDTLVKELKNDNPKFDEDIFRKEFIKGAARNDEKD